MNVCILSGKVIKNATVRGTEPKTLTFTLETKYGYNENEKKDRLAWVPCVLFNPDSEMEALLTTRGQGLNIELEGRLSGSNPDANGGRKFNTEVIVKSKTLTVLQPAK
jgi:single-stranded DNA-binding protein